MSFLRHFMQKMLNHKIQNQFFLELQTSNQQPVLDQLLNLRQLNLP